MNIIKQLREETSLTQKQLAMALNKSEKFVEKLEAGEILPDLQIILNIAEFFDIEADYLLGNVDERKAYKSRIVKTFNKITDEDIFYLERINCEPLTFDFDYQYNTYIYYVIAEQSFDIITKQLELYQLFPKNTNYNVVNSYDKDGVCRHYFIDNQAFENFVAWIAEFDKRVPSVKCEIIDASDLFDIEQAENNK